MWARSGRDSRRGVLCVAYPLDGLRLGSIDRRVAGPVDSALVRGLLETSFDVRPVADAQEALATGIAVNLDHRWYVARYSGQRPPGSPGMDVSLLHDRVLDQLPPGTVVEQTRDSIEVLVAACEADGGVPVRAARTGARRPSPRSPTRGEVVPAKSTFFSPKPGSGIFLRTPHDSR